jgi:hypothetical protein
VTRSRKGVATGEGVGKARQGTVLSVARLVVPISTMGIYIEFYIEFWWCGTAAATAIRWCPSRATEFGLRYETGAHAVDATAQWFLMRVWRGRSMAVREFGSKMEDKGSSTLEAGAIFLPL